MANRIISVLAAGAAIVAVATPASAQQRHWAIPAGDLKAALDAYARQSGRQIIYKSDEVRGVRSAGASGNLSSEGALSAILAGTGFSARSDSSSAVAIVRTGPQTISDDGSAPVPESEDIVVTGTNIRGQQPVGSQVIVIGRKEIERSGHSTALEIVRALPQNFNGGVSNDTGFLPGGAGLGDSASSSNTNSGTALNLRGVGAGATLTLVNGRRLAPSGLAGAYTDVSSLPIGAIERVEVLPDGASALYGSDAIGGVVNFVLRHDFSGAESRASFGTVTKGGLTELVLGQTLGKRWGSGGILITGEHYRAEPLEPADRKAFDLDFRDRGGADRRLTTCTPGTIVVGGQSFGLNGNTGTTHAGANTCSPNDLLIYPRMRRTNIVALADQQIGSIFKIEADANWARSSNERTLGPFSTSVTIPSTNPFYINPLGNGAPVTVLYDQNAITGAPLQRVVTDTYGGGLALVAKPLEGWAVTASVAYGAEKVDQRTGYVDPFSLAARASATTAATALNPFGTAGGNSPDTIAALRNSLRNVYNLKTEQWIYRVVADGPLFALPGGDVRVAVGAERRDIELSSLGTQTYAGLPAANSSFGSHYKRGINAGFGEVVVPLFGEANAVPGLQGLELGFAVRAEDYSDFGSVVVPKAGVTWTPVAGLKIRGNISRSYRAPSPTDLAGQQYSFLYRLPDAQGVGGTSIVMILNGGNDQLNEERARTYNFGFDWAPTPGVHLSGTYYDIAYSGRILVPAFAINVLTDPTFLGVITRGLTSSQQAALCASTTFGGNASGVPGTCTTVPATVLIDTRVRNVAKLNTNGIDLIGSYDFPVGGGTMELQSNLAYVFNYAFAVPGGTREYVNTVGNVPQLKIRSSVSWATKSGFGAAVYMDFVNASHDNRTAPTIHVKSYTSFDVNLSYQLGGDHGPLGHTRLNLNVQNVFDRQPPFVDNFQYGYDYQNYDLRGRFIRLSLTKGW